MNVSASISPSTPFRKSNLDFFLFQEKQNQKFEYETVILIYFYMQVYAV